MKNHKRFYNNRLLKGGKSLALKYRVQVNIYILYLIVLAEEGTAALIGEEALIGTAAVVEAPALIALAGGAAVGYGVY